MTGSLPPDVAGPASGAAPGAAGGATVGEPDPPEEPGPTVSRAGTSTFTIEGRAAPALFVIAWLAGLLGLGLTIVALLGGGGLGPGILLIVGMSLLAIGLVTGAGSQAIERRAQGGHAYAGPSPLLVFGATIPLTYLVAIAAGTPLALLGGDIDRPVAELVLIALQALVTLGVVRLVVTGPGGLSWADIGLTRPVRGYREELAWGAVMAGPAILVTIIVSAILVAVLSVAPDSPLPPAGTDLGLALHLVGGALIAPFAEEVMFRGVATTAWVRSIGVRAGIVRAAILFAVAHVLLVGGATAGEAFALALVGFLGRLPVALILGWVFVRRGTIWAPFALHAMFNGVLIVLAEVALRSGAAGA